MGFKKCLEVFPEEIPARVRLLALPGESVGLECQYVLVRAPLDGLGVPAGSHVPVVQRAALRFTVDVGLRSMELIMVVEKHAGHWDLGVQETAKG